MEGTIDLHIDVAQDGSGWSMSQDTETRPACIIKQPQDTYLGTGYRVVVPFKNDKEREAYSRNEGECLHGYKGIKIPNVKERYMEEQ